MQRFPSVAFVVFLAVSPAQADVEQDKRDCVRPKSSQAQVSACSRLLKTWRTTPQNRAVTLNNRGNAYFRLKQHQRAIADYDEAIRLNPKYARSYNNRGIVYANLGQPHRAIADYTKAIRLNPRFADAYYNRGNSHFRLKQYQQAIANYTQTIRLNPRYANAYFNRGVIYQNIYRKRRQAIEDYRAAYRLGDADAERQLRKMGVEP